MGIRLEVIEFFDESNRSLVHRVPPQRSADIIETYGSERIWINSAGDWGPSDPLAVPKCQIEMKRRGHGDETISKISFGNPMTFLGQCEKFSVDD